MRYLAFRVLERLNLVNDRIEPIALDVLDVARVDFGRNLGIHGDAGPRIDTLALGDCLDLGLAKIS